MNLSDDVAQRIKKNQEIFKKNEDLFKCEIREIMQEILMPVLVNSDFFENNSFLGGTAFRMLYGLKRYSEDLDFTMKSDNINNFSWKPYINKFTDKFSELGLMFSSKESADKYGNKILRISCDPIIALLNGEGLVPDEFTQISNKKRIWVKLETNFAVNSFNDEIKTYNNSPVKVLDLPSLFAGKINACLTRDQTNVETGKKERKDHGRDWYDLVNYIDMQITPNYTFLSEKLKYKGPFEKLLKEHSEIIIDKDWVKEKLFERMRGLNFQELNKEIESITLKENRITLDKDLLTDKINKFGMGSDDWGGGNGGIGKIQTVGLNKDNGTESLIIENNNKNNELSVNCLQHFSLENKKFSEVIPNVDKKSESYSKFEDGKGHICKEHFQSSYIDPKTNQNIYVLERLLYNKDGTYNNHVWQLDKCLSALQVKFFIDKEDSKKNILNNKNRRDGKSSGGWK